MRFTSTLLTAFVAILPFSSVFAAPASILEVQRFSGEKRAGNFIVTFKQNVDKSAWLSQHPDAASHEFESSFLNGFSGKLDEQTLQELRANPDVESIAEDGIMHTMATTTQTNAPWGLARLSQNGRLSNQSPTALTFSYSYDTAAGAGVDIYIVDTGVQTSHQEFGGRAIWGATFGGYPNADGNGHGTHVAATAAGSRFGVAKSANIIAVKVLSDQGSGTVADIVAGLNFVAQRAAQTGRPSIASMSLGGGASTALDNAVASLTRAGIHVTVAAGNSNVDAASTSPARAPSAITVGATTIADARASFSNFGSVVDIFAPGQSVTSAWIGSNTATNTISGTSMATPHVAGLVAYLISVRGNSSPASIQSLVQSLSVRGVLTSIPSSTINALARNDI